MSCFKYSFLFHRRFVKVCKQPILKICTTKTVAESPIATNIQKQPQNIIDYETISLLEKLSLVDCDNKKGIETLEAAVRFADQIMQVDVTDCEPLITVLEDISLITREDQVTDGNYPEDTLKNAALSEDGYFVTPPGNVVLEVADNFNK